MLSNALSWVINAAGVSTHHNTFGSPASIVEGYSDRKTVGSAVYRQRPCPYSIFVPNSSAQSR